MSIFERKTNFEICKDYNISIKVHKFGTEIKKYHRTISYIPEGFEPVERKQTAKGNGINKITESNLARSRENLIDITLANVEIWKSFVTLTFNPKEHPDCDQVQYANKVLHRYKTQVLRSQPEFRYIGTIEAQKNGNWHYHLLTNLEPGSKLLPRRKDKPVYNQEEKKKTILQYYELPYWNYGFSSAFDLKLTDDRFNVALYLLKYLYKDPDNRLFMKKKVYHSQGLNRLKTIKYMITEEKYQELVQEIKEKDTNCKIRNITPKSQYSVPMTIISTSNQMNNNKL